MLLQVDKLGKVAATVEENYWSETKDYDKLTIVEKEGTFGTYISRKPVPAGTPLTNRTYWIPFSSLKEEITLQFNDLLNKVNNIRTSLDAKESNLYAAIRSIISGGVALKQEFGENNDFGISQAFLTQIIKSIQNQINYIRGENVFGLTLTASPNIIRPGLATPVTITGTINGNADEIGITINSESTIVENTNSCTVTVTLTDDTVVTGYAIQNGIRYETSINITKMALIKYGSGSVYSDVTNTVSQLTPIGTYEIEISANNKYVFFCVPYSMQINRATMNGFEFPLNSPVVATIGNVEYKVYQSSNTYDIGNLTIEIE